MAPGVLTVGLSRRGRPRRRAESSEGAEAAGTEGRRSGTREGGASRPRHGVSVSSARRRPRPGAERLGSQAGGAANAGLGGGSRTRRGGRAWAEPPAAQAQWGHVALPVPAGGRGRAPCPGGAAPTPPDTPASRPGGPCRLACHVTESRRPPEVACVTATKIPGVGSVTFLADRGAEGGGDL